MPQVVITDCDHENIAVEEELFGAAGVEVRLPQALTEEAVISSAAQADGLIAQYAPLTARVFQAPDPTILVTLELVPAHA